MINSINFFYFGLVSSTACALFYYFLRTKMAGSSADPNFQLPTLPLKSIIGYESESEEESECSPENNPPVTPKYAEAVDSAFQDVTWFHPYETILNPQFYKYPKWFSGGCVNLCYELLDRHFEDVSRSDPQYNSISFFNKTLEYENDSVPTVHCYELLQKVRRVATFFGKVKQDKNHPHQVLILLPNCLEAIISILACFRLGWLFTVLCSRYEYPIEHRIINFKPTIIVSVNGGFSKINFPKFLGRILKRIRGGGVKYIYLDCKTNEMPREIMDLKQFSISIYNFQGFVNDNRIQLQNDFNIYDINQPLYVAYTSGVTGTPKGCIHSARSIFASIFSDNGFLCRTLDNPKHVQPKTQPKESKQEKQSKPVTYFVCDLQHVVGLMGICVKPLYYKVASVLFEIMLDAADPVDIFQAIDFLKVTNVYISGPYLTDFYLWNPNTKATKENNYSVAAFYTGETYVASKVLRWAEKLFGNLPIYQCFVVTELCGIVTHHQNSPLVPKSDIDLNRDNPLGNAIPLIQARLFKGDREMEGTCWGELFLGLPLPPMMMLYYWENKRLTKSRFKIRKGFFALHDLINFDRESEVVWISKSDATSLYRFDYGFNEEDTELREEIESQVFQHSTIKECKLVVRTDKYGIKKAFLFYTSPIAGLEEQIESVIHYLYGSQLDITAVRLKCLPLTAGGNNSGCLKIADKKMKFLLNATVIRDKDLYNSEFSDFIVKTRDIRKHPNRRYIL